MNVSGMGRRTPALELNLKIAKQYRSGFAARWTLDSNLAAGDKIILSAHWATMAWPSSQRSRGSSLEAE